MRIKHFLRGYQQSQVEAFGVRVVEILREVNCVSTQDIDLTVAWYNGVVLNDESGEGGWKAAIFPWRIIMNSQTRRYILKHIRRTTIVIEQAASDAGDEFLSYLYGMAIHHLEEPEKERRRIPEAINIDPRLGKLAKQLRASVDPKVR